MVYSEDIIDTNSLRSINLFDIIYTEIWHQTIIKFIEGDLT